MPATIPAIPLIGLTGRSRTITRKTAYNCNVQVLWGKAEYLATGPWGMNAPFSDAVTLNCIEFGIVPSLQFHLIGPTDQNPNPPQFMDYGVGVSSKDGGSLFKKLGTVSVPIAGKDDAEWKPGFFTALPYSFEVEITDSFHLVEWYDTSLCQVYEAVDTTQISQTVIAVNQDTVLTIPLTRANVKFNSTPTNDIITLSWFDPYAVLFKPSLTSNSITYHFNGTSTTYQCIGAAVSHSVQRTGSGATSPTTVNDSYTSVAGSATWQSVTTKVGSADPFFGAKLNLTSWWRQPTAWQVSGAIWEGDKPATTSRQVTVATQEHSYANTQANTQTLTATDSYNVSLQGDTHTFVADGTTYGSSGMTGSDTYSYQHYTPDSTIYARDGGLSNQQDDSVMGGWRHYINLWGWDAVNVKQAPTAELEGAPWKHWDTAGTKGSTYVATISPFSVPVTYKIVRYDGSGDTLEYDPQTYRTIRVRIRSVGLSNLPFSFGVGVGNTMWNPLLATTGADGVYVEIDFDVLSLITGSVVAYTPQAIEDYFLIFRAGGIYEISSVQGVLKNGTVANFGLASAPAAATANLNANTPPYIGKSGRAGLLLDFVSDGLKTLLGVAARTPTIAAWVAVVNNGSTNFSQGGSVGFTATDLKPAPSNPANPPTLTNDVLTSACDLAYLGGMGRLRRANKQLINQPLDPQNGLTVRAEVVTQFLSGYPGMGDVFQGYGTLNIVSFWRQYAPKTSGAGAGALAVDSARAWLHWAKTAVVTNFYMDGSPADATMPTAISGVTGWVDMDIEPRRGELWLLGQLTDPTMLGLYVSQDRGGTGVQKMAIIADSGAVIVDSERNLIVLLYQTHGSNTIMQQQSSDGGATWSAAVAAQYKGAALAGSILRGDRDHRQGGALFYPITLADGSGTVVLKSLDLGQSWVLLTS